MQTAVKDIVSRFAIQAPSRADDWHVFVGLPTGYGKSECLTVFSKVYGPGTAVWITWSYLWGGLVRGKKTRMTRTPAFWGYPPPPPPPRLMIINTIESYWIPSQKNNRSRTEQVTERTRFSKSLSNDLEDISQDQRSSHATHLLMLLIICTKYGKNPPRTVDATERTRFSMSRPNDLEDIGQGLRSSHATHLLMLVIICTKYGKNAPRTVDATERTRFSRSRPNDLEDISQGQRSSYATHLLMLVIICTKYGKNPPRTVDATERTRFSMSRPNDLEDIGQGQRSSHATHLLMLVIICAKYGKNPSRIVDFFFKVKAEKLKKIAKIWNFQILKKRNTRHTFKW